MTEYGDDMNEYLINIPDANLFKITARILNIERETTDHVDLYLAYEEVDQLNSVSIFNCVIFFYLLYSIVLCVINYN